MKNYKYTLLGGSDSDYLNPENKNSKPSVLRYLGFCILLVIFTLYYTNKMIGTNNTIAANQLNISLKKTFSLTTENPLPTTFSHTITLKSENTTKQQTKDTLSTSQSKPLEVSTELSSSTWRKSTEKAFESSSTMENSNIPISTKDPFFTSPSNRVEVSTELALRTISNSTEKGFQLSLTMRRNNIPIPTMLAPTKEISSLFITKNVQLSTPRLEVSSTSKLPSQKEEILMNSTNFLRLTSKSIAFVTLIPTPQVVSLADQQNPFQHFAISQKPTPPVRPKAKISKSILPERYYVRTQHCNIPWVDPFTRAIKKMFKPEKYKNCSNDEAIVTSTFNATVDRYILNINDPSEKNISCCYRQIVRSGSGRKADEKFSLLPCVNFSQSFAVPAQIDAMIVNCTTRSTGKVKVKQLDAFSFIQTRRFSKIKEHAKTEPRRKASVIIIGIDSLSRINFRRTMPATAKFLESNNWIELEGYNKVGDNTFPNLMPLLTGLNATAAYSQCKPTSVGGLDKCDFISKDFKESGYKTAYAEDVTVLSTFNYLKKGFVKPPTDYYLRPLMLAVEKHLKVVKKESLAYCIGRKHSAEYVYDFGLEFANRWSAKSAAFGLFWTNSFSHNSYKTPSSMDAKMREYLERMANDGILNESIVLFLSDHGCRWGPLLNLPEGFLEERLPTIFLSLPEWFRETYPDFTKAISINKNRLTTPFDIYETMKHILHLGGGRIIKPNRPTSCPTAQSIFYEIPENRTCADACIPEHWCTCDSYEIMPKKNADVKKVTNLVVEQINEYLRKSNFTSICHALTTSSIMEAQLKIEDPSEVRHSETFRIKFKTNPKNAKFEATAVYDLNLHSVNVLMQDISRLDTYAPYSKCINDKLAKKFCICR